VIKKKMLSHTVSADNLQARVQGKEEVMQIECLTQRRKVAKAFLNLKYLSLRLSVFA
jgi:hypothetical protein